MKEREEQRIKRFHPKIVGNRFANQKVMGGGVIEERISKGILLKIWAIGHKRIVGKSWRLTQPEKTRQSPNPEANNRIDPTILVMREAIHKKCEQQTDSP